MSRRVVITGTGVLTPIGNSTEEFHNSLKQGRNGVNKITLFDTNQHNVNIAAELKIKFDDYFEKRQLNRMDRFTAMALIASDEAIKQSNLNNNINIDKNRIGVIIGSGIGGIGTFENQHKKLLTSPRRVSPFFIPSIISDIASGQVSIKYGFKGPNYSVVSACSTASHAIGDAMRTIKYGDADIIISGGSDASITPMSIAGFSNMKALSKNNDTNLASRPFDLNRDGFVMGEGAGILVLEELEHAKKRNVNILGELIGYGATADAFHLTSPSPNGEGAVRSMKLAIQDANCDISDIDYINAHGTSTPFNDKIETLAIKKVFKKYAYNVDISSTKSMTGHLLGAAGAIESIASIFAIREGKIPPTINHSTHDDEISPKLNLTLNKTQSRNVNVAMSNTFGFGGHNTCVIFKKYD